LSLIAGGVAHDLNNALGPLVALPEAILNDLARAVGAAVPSEVIQDLEMIRAAGQRAALTIRDLLALGRPADPPQGLVELNRTLKQERSALGSLCERDARIEIQLELNQEPLLVVIDKIHLLRAITNLVINAADAIEGNGTITVRARREQIQARIDGIEPVEPGNYAVIEVVDTGQGIAEQHLPRIMEPFFSAKQRQGINGTGLGLAIVHRIVKDANGYLHVTSKLGHGTTFSIYLPFQSELECPESTRPEPSIGGHERILVVDDEQVQLRTARRVLEQLGYKVTLVNSGREAVELFRTRYPHDPFDLVIVDMVMPGELNGIQTIELMHQIRPGQRVLIASGYAPDQMDETAADRGLPWLAKPYTSAKLAALVRSVLVAPASNQPERGSLSSPQN
jgi:CheY-like chemotaxis protein